MLETQQIDVILAYKQLKRELVNWKLGRRNIQIKTLMSKRLGNIDNSTRNIRSLTNVTGVPK